MPGSHGGQEADRIQRLRAIGRLREAYLAALLAGSEAAAERVVGEAVDAGLPQATICDAVITPAMRRIGELWAQGEISVADEHLATQLTLRMLVLVGEGFRVAARRPGHRVLLAGIEQERHSVGLEMAAIVLSSAGYDVRSLGADVPLAALAPAVERHRPALVGLSATLAATAHVLPAAVYELRSADARLGIIVGGPAASLRMEATPGVAVCTHVTDAVEIADALVQRAALN